jgi:hypothetical protein
LLPRSRLKPREVPERLIPILLPFYGFRRSFCDAALARTDWHAPCLFYDSDR